MKNGIVFELNHSKAVIMTKEGEFLSVPAHEEWHVGQEVSISEFELKANEKKVKQPDRKRKGFPNKNIWIAMVAAILFFMIPLSTLTEASTIVTLDINPSFELEVKKNEVVSIKALNEDASLVISSMDDTMKSGDLYQVTSYIIDKTKEFGYINSTEESFIMVGVTESKNLEPSKYETYIQETLSQKQLNSEVMVLSASKSQKKEADNKGVSLGKYLLQTKEKENGIIISDEQLKNDSVKEIIKKVKAEEQKSNKNKNKNNEKNNGNKNNQKVNPNKPDKAQPQKDNKDKVKKSNNEQKNNKDKGKDKAKYQDKEQNKDQDEEATKKNGNNEDSKENKGNGNGKDKDNKNIDKSNNGHNN